MATVDGEKTGGRKKGTPNKATKAIQDILGVHGYDPLVEIIKSLKKEKPTLTQIASYTEELRDMVYNEKDVSMLVKKFSNDYLDINRKTEVNLRLLEFIYPKRKAIDLKTDDDAEPPSFTINFNAPKKEGE